MFPRKLVSGFALLSLGLLLMFIVACSSGGDNRSANTTNANSNANPATTPAATTSSAPKAKLNINTASQADFLGTIPNLGNRMVHEFEEYRPYKSILQFRKEIGKYVDQSQVAEYEKYIFVPIDVNQSDAATLQQIPGLDANEAQELIAGRPYASPDGFLAKLADKISAAELNIAKTYLAQQ
jgi:DNA uptake protein ComE-like DNA-binding protein